MTHYEISTDLTPAEVFTRARSFFSLQGGPCSAFPEREGDGFLRLHLEVGEVVIGVMERDGSTWVRGSASRGAHLLTRFLMTLAAPYDLKQTTHRQGVHETHAASVEEMPRPR